VSFSERLDGIISAFAPTWGAERAAARMASDEAARLSNYRGSQATRLDRPNPASKGVSPDVMLERDYDRRDLVDRARQLERSSVLANAMLARTTESVVGNGFALQCKTADPVWNKSTEARFKAWATKDADVRGLSSFGELLALVLRSYLRDGDVAAVKLSTGNLRIVESDEIATPSGMISPDLVDGIALDAVGRPVAFMVTQQPRTISGDRRSIPDHARVPAADVLFLARRERAGQTRGISAFAGVTWILDQIDGNIEAVTVAARMAACFGLVIKRKNHGRGLGTETGPDGIARRKLRVEPGAFFEVEPDEDVKPIQGQTHTQQFAEFTRTLARIASTSFGLPIELLMMDFEKTNYSNARAALLQARKVWLKHQDMLKAFCADVFTWWVLREMELGAVAVREDALEHGWIAPGWQWIDPVSEIQATLAAIDCGLQTKTEALMMLGKDPEEQFEQIEKEQEISKKLGIDARSTLTRDKIEPAAPGSTQKPSA
jgi:lambda family phage portal protein